METQTLTPNTDTSRTKQIESLYDSYKPAILKAAETLMNTMEISEYIYAVNYANEELITSKRWAKWDREMKREHAFAYTAVMHFLHDIKEIEAKRSREREILGI